MELLLLMTGAAIGLVVLYLMWRGLRSLVDFLENAESEYDDGEW